MASARVKIGHIAGKRGISMTNAKRYYYEKLDAEARGERLPFYKWAKSNLGYSSAAGDDAASATGSKNNMLKSAWKTKKPLVIGVAVVVGYLLWKKFGKK